MRKFIAPLLLLSTALILFFSCRRAEIENPETPDAQSNRFFNVPSNASPQIKAVAEAIKKQNEKFGFLSSIIKKGGYPRWDKVKLVDHDKKTITQKTASDSGSGQTLYIPFVLDTQSTTNAVLKVRLNEPDTTYRMMYAIDYRSFGFDTTDHSKWNARDLFHLFSTFDYTIFGHKRFRILDDSLFKAHNDSLFVVLTLKTFLGQNVSGKATTFAQQCDVYEECHYYFGCEGGGGMVRTSTVPGCPSDYCTTYEACSWYEDGSTGGGDGTGGPGPGDGTGGGGGWWSGGGDPCNSGGRTSIVEPNGCEPGWEPIIDDIPPPAQLVSLDYSQVTDQCLIEIIANLGSPGHTSAILYDYYGYFNTNVTHKYKVKYYVNNDLKDLNGVPIPGHTDVTTLPDGSYQMAITLNPSLFQHTSKEYVTTILLHELLHGIITVNKPNLTESKDQHAYIFDKKNSH